MTDQLINDLVRAVAAILARAERAKGGQNA